VVLHQFRHRVVEDQGILDSMLSPSAFDRWESFRFLFLQGFVDFDSPRMVCWSHRRTFEKISLSPSIKMGVI
jgi:hypothetical protein